MKELVSEELKQWLASLSKIDRLREEAIAAKNIHRIRTFLGR